MSKKQLIEKIIITILPILVASITVVCYGDSQRMDVLSGIDFLKTIIGVYATLLGFAITAESILATFKGGEYTDLIIRAGHLKTVLFSFLLTNVILLIGLIFYIVLIMSNNWNLWIEKLVVCSIVLIFSYFGISVLYFSMMLLSQRK